MPLLHWLTRDADINTATHAPYRLLEEVPKQSHGDRDTGNMLIHGDNLDALKALLPYYAGKVKCIFIDPPYNTKSAFEHYDDNLEHTQWLAMMYPRLELLQRLLSKDGSIWVTIDDNEAHYLKVIMDEVFGRKNFVANCVWQKRTSPDFRAVLGDAHDDILVFARDAGAFREKANLLSLHDKQLKEYKNPDNDPRGSWVSRDFSAQGYRPNQMYKIITRVEKNIFRQKAHAGKTLRSPILSKLQMGVFGSGRMERVSHGGKTIFQRRKGGNLGLGGQMMSSAIIKKQSRKSYRFLESPIFSIHQNQSGFCNALYK